MKINGMFASLCAALLLPATMLATINTSWQSVSVDAKGNITVSPVKALTLDLANFKSVLSSNYSYIAKLENYAVSSNGQNQSALLSGVYGIYLSSGSASNQVQFAVYHYKV